MQEETRHSDDIMVTTNRHPKSENVKECMNKDLSELFTHETFHHVSKLLILYIGRQKHRNYSTLSIVSTCLVDYRAAVNCSTALFMLTL